MGYTTDRERQLREARKHGRWTQVRQLVAQGVGANLKKTRTKKKAAKKTAAKKTASAPQTSSSSDNT